LQIYSASIGIFKKVCLRMIEAVLWDFGGVLTESPFQAFNRFEAERGLPRDFLRKVNAVNPDTNAWARFERNEIDLDTFGRLFAAESAALGHAVDGRDVIPLLAGALRPAMVTALRRCAAQLKCACITNNVVSTDAGPASAAGAEADVAAVFALFDLVIESSKLGLRKPDPAIYRYALDALGIAPEQAVYLDDLGINLKPARALGMTTIKVTTADAALDALEAALGLTLR
jgi:putative hydrolase of the HAD superfamily